MVIIDSATDLIAMESGGSRSQIEPNRTPYWRPEESDPWSDIYLKGAYEKRVQDLEQFAQDKNYDYLSIQEVSYGPYLATMASLLLQTFHIGENPSLNFF